MDFDRLFCMVLCCKRIWREMSWWLEGGGCVARARHNWLQAFFLLSKLIYYFSIIILHVWTNIIVKARIWLKKMTSTKSATLSWTSNQIVPVNMRFQYQIGFLLLYLLCDRRLLHIVTRVAVLIRPYFVYDCLSSLVNISFREFQSWKIFS